MSRGWEKVGKSNALSEVGRFDSAIKIANRIRDPEFLLQALGSIATECHWQDNPAEAARKTRDRIACDRNAAVAVELWNRPLRADRNPRTALAERVDDLVVALPRDGRDSDERGAERGAERGGR